MAVLEVPSGIAVSKVKAVAGWVLALVTVAAAGSGSKTFTLPAYLPQAVSLVLLTVVPSNKRRAVGSMLPGYVGSEGQTYVLMMFVRARNVRYLKLALEVPWSKTACCST